MFTQVNLDHTVLPQSYSAKIWSKPTQSVTASGSLSFKDLGIFQSQDSHGTVDGSEILEPVDMATII